MVLNKTSTLAPTLFRHIASIVGMERPKLTRSELAFDIISSLEQYLVKDFPKPFQVGNSIRRHIDIALVETMVYQDPNSLQIIRLRTGGIQVAAHQKLDGGLEALLKPVHNRLLLRMKRESCLVIP